MSTRKSKSDRKRPPKRWWYDCVRGVRESMAKSGRYYSPEKVCGANWYRKQSGASYKAAKKRHYAGVAAGNYCRICRGPHVYKHGRA